MYPNHRGERHGFRTSLLSLLRALATVRRSAHRITPPLRRSAPEKGDQGRAIRTLLARIADKWALTIMAMLYTQRLRFSELQQRIQGISQRMLSLTLRKLERDGLVIRTVHAEVPPRVEYELSELATTLIPHAIALAERAIEHNPEIDAHREAHDKRPR
ncbi:winged helix-turn-helix transcriptional regulator [Nocardia niwae]|uniref:winged helix-turn-helix transcriptional regulator n=1 Tax=Nocardia niwae TaxID=626084 RepID=UPI001FDEF9B3|nr:helix-turn-helix domain-containing protein [Nocardia niwae]